MKQRLHLREGGRISFVRRISSLRASRFISSVGHSYGGEKCVLQCSTVKTLKHSPILFQMIHFILLPSKRSNLWGIKPHFFLKKKKKKGDLESMQNSSDVKKGLDTYLTQKFYSVSAEPFPFNSKMKLKQKCVDSRTARGMQPRIFKNPAISPW